MSKNFPKVHQLRSSGRVTMAVLLSLAGLAVLGFGGYALACVIWPPCDGGGWGSIPGWGSIRVVRWDPTAGQSGDWIQTSDVSIYQYDSGQGEGSPTFDLESEWVSVVFPPIFNNTTGDAIYVLAGDGRSSHPHSSYEKLTRTGYNSNLFTNSGQTLKVWVCSITFGGQYCGVANITVERPAWEWSSNFDLHETGPGSGTYFSSSPENAPNSDGRVDLPPPITPDISNEGMFRIQALSASTADTLTIYYDLGQGPCPITLTNEGGGVFATGDFLLDQSNGPYGIPGVTEVVTPGDIGTFWLSPNFADPALCPVPVRLHKPAVLCQALNLIDHLYEGNNIDLPGYRDVSIDKGRTVSRIDFVVRDVDMSRYIPQNGLLYIECHGGWGTNVDSLGRYDNFCGFFVWDVGCSSPTASLIDPTTVTRWIGSTHYDIVFLNCCYSGNGLSTGVSEMVRSFGAESYLGWICTPDNEPWEWDTWGAAEQFFDATQDLPLAIIVANVNRGRGWADAHLRVIGNRNQTVSI